MSQRETEQCRALTDDGDRCRHSVDDGRFCHQHSETDPVADGATDGSQPSSDPGASTDAETSDADSNAEASGDATSDGATSDDATEGPFDGSREPQLDDAGLVTVRRALQTLVPELVGAPMDGVAELAARDDGWFAIVEVIERQSVPDTQDILGRYEVEFDDDGTITGYKRIGRYRRADTGHDESIE